MNEIDRILHGMFNDKYLQEEIRGGVLVSSKTKKIWSIQIDLLKQVENICNKYGLNYYATGGTAIGAVRHKGFIPWDDDLDIMMPRKDYDTFLSVAQKELDEQYFIQTPLTDKYYYRPFARVRNSNTTCISKHDKKVKCNNGICIDIFPLDGFEDSKRCRRTIKRMRIADWCAVNKYHIKSAVNHRFLRWLIYFYTLIRYPYGLKGIYNKHENDCRFYSSLNTNKVGIQFIDLGQRNLNKCTWDVNWFNGYVEVPFEYTTIRLAVGYDNILRAEFGNYMELPPEEKRVGKHEYEFDPDTPYKKYCHEKYGIKY